MGKSYFAVKKSIEFLDNINNDVQNTSVECGLKTLQVKLSLLSSRNAPSELDYPDFLSMKWLGNQVIIMKIQIIHISSDSRHVRSSCTYGSSFI